MSNGETPKVVSTSDSKDLQTSFVRTVTPYAVSFLLTWALTSNFSALHSLDTAKLTSLVSFLLGSLYYFVVRKIEMSPFGIAHPAIGRFLGSPVKPAYALGSITGLITAQPATIIGVIPAEPAAPPAADAPPGAPDMFGG